MLKGKKGCRVVICLLAVLMMMLPAFPAKASEKEKAEAALQGEEIITGTLQKTLKTVEIKEMPDEDSDVLETLPKGTPIIVYGESQDSWSRIEYRGIEGYIESDALETYQTKNDENLEQEFQTIEEETLRTMDEYELLQKEKRTSRIWGAVIAILVMAIFVVGIFSALKQNREKEGEER